MHISEEGVCRTSNSIVLCWKNVSESLCTEIGPGCCQPIFILIWRWGDPKLDPKLDLWILAGHSDKKSKNQTGNSAAMFIKPKNHKIDLILPWRCFLEFLAFYFFLNVKRMFCYEVEFENRALETQENSTMVKLNQFWRYFV